MLREKKEIKKAVEFLNSMRGQYIVGQALYKAIEVMEAVPAPHTEVANIKDMKYLMDTLFPIFAISERARKEMEYLKGGKK